MKRTLAVVSLALMCLVPGLALADGSSEATADVFVTIDPNIGLMPVSPFIDMGTWQTGEFTGTIPFRVDANTEQVRLQVAASNLYKGADPFAGLVPPVDIFQPDGVTVTAELGNPTGGDDHNVAYTGPYTIDDFPGFITEEITFESAQPGHFSQNVELVVTWTQPDPEKPMGEYGGKVRLMAWVVLPPP